MLMMTTWLIGQGQVGLQAQGGVDRAAAGAGRPVGTGAKVTAAAGSGLATVRVGDEVGATRVGYSVGGISAREAVGPLRDDATGCGGVEARGVGADNPKFPVHPANKSTS
jgi:hypothetical protein